MAKLTAAKRNALPKKAFALRGGRYPIEDKSHARNALARVSQNGSPAEKAEVRAKVHSKFPDIGESDRAEGGRVEGDKAKSRLDRPHKKKG
jgi:hypothetical protein